MCHLCGTKHRGVSYTITSTPLQGYCDSDYAGDVDGRKSTTGWIRIKNGGPISWQSKLQSVVARSTCEAEYYGAGSATKEALWLRKTLSDFGLPVVTLPIFTDNQASLSLLKHGVVSPATKHIAVIYHAVRDSVLRGDVIFSYTSIDHMVADFLTKALPVPKFRYCLRELGMHIKPHMSLWSSVTSLTKYNSLFVAMCDCGHCSFPLLMSMQLYNNGTTKLLFLEPVCILHSKSGGQLSLCFSRLIVSLFS
jgi:hypothetical protein